MKNQDEILLILRELEKKPNISQRELASNVNFSLGKLNYCINSLKLKGLIKIKNFKTNQNKPTKNQNEKQKPFKLSE